ncbi:MAG: PatB family C-S lyase [Paracoccaceae bacterium]
MPVDFDKMIAIKDHHTMKYDDMEKYVGVTADDAISMWVADMDFPAADCIRDALRAEIDNGFLGYFGNPDPVAQAACDWISRRHGWPPQPDWFHFCHGIVAGYATVLEAFSDPGDHVILFSPVYHSFFGKTRAKGREILQSPLIERNDRYEMDLDALAASLTGREKILVFCSPHNPGGRLWSTAEIRAVAAFCKTHDLILISDEIHMDLIHPGAAHIATAVAAPDAMPRLIVLTAASKTFNIAGGETGMVIIGDPELRATYHAAHMALGGTPNRFGMIMTKAALTGGEPWLDEARAYIAENFRLWHDRIGALPGVRVMDMQATYLAWVDFTDTGLSDDEITQRLAKDARIAASPGPAFGTGGALHKRFNVAMPRARLIEAIERIEAAFADLQ